MAARPIRKKKTPAAPPANAIIGQSGGPTVVINQSLVGAVLEARKHKQIAKFYGALHGVKGILNRQFVDLTAEPVANLEAIAKTPSAVLGSVRMKPKEAQCAEMFKIMQSMNVRYFFYIGGNDSAETAQIVSSVADKENYELRVFHIPKTIDNDLRESDHCPGYASAAKFVAQAFMGLDLDNRALPGVNIDIVMGRDAGFLTAASVLGRQRPDSAPHLVYVPERAFSEEKFIKDVDAVLAKYGRCVVAASEGIRGDDGVRVAERIMKGQTDQFGNVQLSGSGALGDYLTQVLKRGKPDLRVRADTLGYLQRSFAGVVSDVDAAEAREVGRMAVRLAVSGTKSASISIKRVKGPRYRANFVATPLEKVARVTRDLPPAYINKDGNNITSAFMKYAGPLVGELPKIAFLKGKAVKK